MSSSSLVPINSSEAEAETETETEKEKLEKVEKVDKAVDVDKSEEKKKKVLKIPIPTHHPLELKGFIFVNWFQHYIKGYLKEITMRKP